MLILAGALLVLGLYLWERYRRASATRRASVRQTPVVAEQQPGQFPPAKLRTPPPLPGAPRQVIALHVISLENLPGPDIIAALNAVDMQLGPMRIFHRWPPAPHREERQRRVLLVSREAGGRERPPESESPPQAVFSLANMVEPGHIPAEQIENFSTPGLVLFMTLPNVLDGMTAFEDMFAATRQLAEKLGAEVYDEQRNILTLQALEHTRERIREWQRRQLLAQAQSSS